MEYASLAEKVAAELAREHACGPECICGPLRKIPEVAEVLELRDKIGKPVPE